MERHSAVAVALGGAAGAGVRWSIVEAFDDASAATGAWPWGVFVANLLGCALLGVAVTRLRGQPGSIVLGATVGFCGALTTFSAFAVDAALFMRGDELLQLVAYLVLSFGGGAVAYIGARSAGRAREAAT